MQKERKLLHVILEHIREIEVRKLYLGKAYSSIYEYLTKELGYSGSAAMRRLEAARLIHEVPVVAERIQEGALNLSQIGELSRAIKEKEKVSGQKVTAFQKQELVSVVSGKTIKQTQHELARVLDLPIKEYDTQKVQKDESVRLELTLSKEQYEKLMQCKDLAAHILLQENGTVSLSEVIEFIANQYLDEKFGRNKKVGNHTSEKVAEKNVKASHSNKLLLNEPMAKKNSLVKNENKPDHLKDLNLAIVTTDAVVERKSVTPKLRRFIFNRDKSCQFIDLKTGHKCTSTFALQVDHKISKWAGGRNHHENLQLLCGQHNREKYRREVNLRFREMP
ncbi:HNH endonuclease [Bdellovibrio reynosensis]|uniref:HNH endonuclease n=1 Tax=Bdellovibrio reynosensis TaxID=2835041 RepID=A0ABY4C8J0_9BACT|nr:HNH endonuclease signature motif containing protein [Bdellovibrio reynosensis]UOF01296.1 HNH endonuclease [Bdellovibrio reynosensis]